MTKTKMLIIVFTSIILISCKENSTDTKLNIHQQIITPINDSVELHDIYLDNRLLERYIHCHGMLDGQAITYDLSGNISTITYYSEGYEIVTENYYYTGNNLDSSKIFVNTTTGLKNGGYAYFKNNEPIAELSSYFRIIPEFILTGDSVIFKEYCQDTVIIVFGTIDERGFLPYGDSASISNQVPIIIDKNELIGDKGYGVIKLTGSIIFADYFEESKYYKKQTYFSHYILVLP